MIGTLPNDLRLSNASSEMYANQKGVQIAYVAWTGYFNRDAMLIYMKQFDGEIVFMMGHYRNDFSDVSWPVRDDGVPAALREEIVGKFV